MNATVNFSSQELNFSFSGNNISNESLESCAIDKKPLGPKEVRVAINVLTMIVALVGNSLLIVAFVKMKVPLMLLIANMAASDLLTAIFFIPRLITSDIVGSTAFQIQGLAGTIMCKMVFFLSDVSLSVSTHSVVIIAVERFLAVVYPLKTRRITTKTRHLLVALTWFVAMAIHTPYLYAMKLVKDGHDKKSCVMSLDAPTKGGYGVFVFVTVLVAPLLVVSILYPIIFTNLRLDKMSAHRSTKGGKRARRRNINLLQLGLATVMTFATCWMPYTVIVSLMLLAPGTLPKCSFVFKVVDDAFRVLSSCYSAINPVICFIFLRNFRGQLLIMCKPKNRRSLNISVRSRSGTGNTSIGVELVYATSNLGASIQDTTE